MRLSKTHPEARYGRPVFVSDAGQDDKIPDRDAVRNARHLLDLSTSELGRQVGKSGRTIEDYEQGRYRVPSEVLMGLAMLLDKTSVD